MRHLGGILLVTAVGLAPSIASAAAIPVMPNVGMQNTAIIQAAGGCGRGWHPNWQGVCVPNRRSYYGPYPYGRPYYGDGHEPWNRPSPGDYGAADQLNRQQLGRPWY